MFNGTNASNKEFDVIDEDGSLLGSFDVYSDAVKCGNAARWYAGEINIRRDDRRTTARRSNHIIVDTAL